ncbi:hypothetical protein ACROYT_G027980 [Oculina patagonica]
MKATLRLVIFVMILFCVGETAVLKPERFETKDNDKRSSAIRCGNICNEKGHKQDTEIYYLCLISCGILKY